MLRWNEVFTRFACNDNFIWRTCFYINDCELNYLILPLIFESLISILSDKIESEKIIIQTIRLSLLPYHFEYLISKDKISSFLKCLISIMSGKIKSKNKTYLISIQNKIRRILEWWDYQSGNILEYHISIMSGKIKNFNSYKNLYFQWNSH